jgi:FAD/FMN-containing dehydrogenase
MPQHALYRSLVSAGLTGRVTGPDDPGYDGARRVWNGCADRRPAAIVRAAGPEDVRRVVAIAADAGALLAVRGGGHSIPGLSTCDGGIVLDLGGMARVSVSQEARRASVGGGALLGDLDRAGAPHGLVVPAGVISHTGAGGLTLGGGMGWLSRRYGLTIDHLVSADLVTAAGELLCVDADSDPDLFWGLRGGGGNFGVVTNFTYRMRELGPVEARSWTYPGDRVRGALAALSDREHEIPRNATVSFLLTGAGLSFTALQSGAELDPALWTGLDALDGPGAPGGRFTDFVAFQSRNDDGVPWGRRYYSRGGFLATLSDAAIGTMIEIAQGFPVADAEIYLLQLGGAVADVDDADTAYTGRAAGWYWIVQPIWDDPADDLRCIAFGRAAAARLAALSAVGNYVNEQGDATVEIARQSYGEAKYRRLGALKARMDPGNLFRLNQNILPAA